MAKKLSLRDVEIKNLNGANLGTSISKNTDVLVYKNKSGRKFEKARALGIKTHQFDEFKALVMKG